MNNKILLSIVITQHGKDYALENYYKDIKLNPLFFHKNEPIEIIVTDDKDNKEPAYIKELFRQGLNIRFVFSDKDGIANNRNNGLWNAEGRYITFIDAPDSLRFDFKVVNNLLSTDYDVITFTVDKIVVVFILDGQDGGKRELVKQ